MEWFKKYQYPILCGVVGIILACLIISFGFFKTLFVLIFGALGIVIGLYIQKNYINNHFYLLEHWYNREKCYTFSFGYFLTT